jgi:hypothetical protein
LNHLLAGLEGGLKRGQLPGRPWLAQQRLQQGLPFAHQLAELAAQPNLISRPELAPLALGRLVLSLDGPQGRLV